MKKIIAVVVLFVIGIILGHLFVGWIEMQFNPIMWDKYQRGYAIIQGMIFWFMIGVWYACYESEKDN